MLIDVHVAMKRILELTTVSLCFLLLGCNALFKGPSMFSRTAGTPGPPFKLCYSLPEADLTADQLSSQLTDNLKQADEQIKQILQEDGTPGGAVLSLVYRDTLLWTGGYGLKNMHGM